MSFEQNYSTHLSRPVFDVGTMHLNNQQLYGLAIQFAINAEAAIYAIVKVIFILFPLCEMIHLMPLGI